MTQRRCSDGAYFWPAAGLEFPASVLPAIALTCGVIVFAMIMTSALIPSHLGTVLQLKMAFANFDLRVLFDTAEMCVRVNYLFFALIRPGSPGCRQRVTLSQISLLPALLLQQAERAKAPRQGILGAGGHCPRCRHWHHCAHALQPWYGFLFWYFPSPRAWSLHFHSARKIKYIPSSPQSGGLLSAIGSVFAMILVCAAGQPPLHKTAFLMVFGFLQGCSIGPLLEVVHFGIDSRYCASLLCPFFAFKWNDFVFFFCTDRAYLLHFCDSNCALHSIWPRQHHCGRTDWHCLHFRIVHSVGLACAKPFIPLPGWSSQLGHFVHGV